MQPNYFTCKNTGIRRWLLFALLVGFALFPVEWVAVFSPTLNWVITTLFPTDTQHAIGHLGLFCTLGVFTLLTFPMLRRSPWRYLALMLAIAVGQEAFQLVFKQRGIEFDEWRDALVDLVGIVVAFVGVRAART